MSFIIVLFFLSLSLFSLPCSAGDGKKRIIMIETMPVPVVLEHSRWFVKGMKDLGYENGKNVEIVILKAEGDRNRAITLLNKALSQGKPDLVVTFATLASQAAFKVLKGTDPFLFRQRN